MTGLMDRGKTPKKLLTIYISLSPLYIYIYIHIAVDLTRTRLLLCPKVAISIFLVQKLCCLLLHNLQSEPFSYLWLLSLRSSSFNISRIQALVPEETTP
ncbi:Hypothetical predicted protein [Octopus vulgaris]|uniref:Uncharacterized protein n=1 Tax=Octopus vulgaris TaxID=6645 RepID=A0AA36FCT1_OCTVU|nr:Hypothetical predicted protein [Octopus vulgaris]